MALQCAFVALGGAVGAVGRYLLGLAPIFPKSGFPCATLLINLIGAFAIGLIAEAAARRGVQNSGAVLFLKVGVCGGFTTFSTFSAEVLQLLRAQQHAGAAAYAAASLAVSVLCVWIGWALAERWLVRV